jgi:hypothetical protein
MGQSIGDLEALWEGVLGRLWRVFSGRDGGGKRKRQDTFSRVGFRWMMRAFKQPHFSIFYIIY